MKCDVHPHDAESSAIGEVEAVWRYVTEGTEGDPCPPGGEDIGMYQHSALRSTHAASYLQVSMW